jgi:uncharacterized protein
MLHFLILCALLSWPLQLAASANPGWALPLLALAGIGPTVAATIVTRGAVWRALHVAPPLGLVVVALLGPLALVAVATAIDVSLGGRLLFGVPFIGAILLPPIGEELGWRGYLQPTLARSHGPLVAAFGVGIAWAIWHLVPAAIAGERGIGLALFALSIISWSLVFAWLHERGRGRVWLAVALHAGLNATPLFVADTTLRAQLLRITVIVVAGALAARALTRT